MPRKREEKPANFYAMFPERLREIMQERGTTQKELAEYVGKSRQAIGYYADGSSSPDWETLANIARYFGVSADWLIGLSDTQSIDFDIQQICKYTGLSEKSIEFLSGKGNPYIDAINVLLESSKSASFVSYLQVFFACGERSEKYRQMNDEEYASFIDLLSDTDYTIAARSELKSLYLQSACDVLRDIIRDEDIRQRLVENRISLRDV